MLHNNQYLLATTETSVFPVCKEDQDNHYQSVINKKERC